MLNAFLHFIEKESLFLPHQPVLLTVSGGIDSVVMVELFRQAGLPFGIAHCNFGLRGSESQRDESFVRELAQRLNVRFFSRRFPTESFARQNHLSVQMAARELRYSWFNELMADENYDYAATAHHLDDQIETLMINLTRGTGLNGLQGIHAKQGRIIRPLMFATRREIEQFQLAYALPFCLDSSNLSDKYTRNKIRHEIMPILETINPDFRNGITQTIRRLQDAGKMVAEKINEKRTLVCTEDQNTTLISIPELLKLSPITAYLTEFLAPLGFNYPTIEKIAGSLTGISGKLFLSPTHCLLKDRRRLIVTPLDIGTPQAAREYFIDADVHRLNTPLPIRIEREEVTVNLRLDTRPEVANLDLALIRFPLWLRKWKRGDRFYPLGMNQSKKVSDFFIDEKLSLIGKSNAWILESDGKIIWIVGHRIDNRFAITSRTRNVLRIELLL
ncbi:MAG: tRNA lysidine(34) synthetase TilS [Bacteroidales bacterium]|nr:tRNA lysidine(34) synthetase TilS [Lentimicrobiaceae bacterium]MDD5694542.1 tRNA lysidine(34) synthetase TilS [Bacteroidales bacterium]